MNHIKTAPRRYIVHAVERHQPADAQDQKRKQAAWDSWDRLYCEQGVIPSHYWHYERDATQIGDHRKLPYLKDVLKWAMRQSRPADIIFLTNDDVWLHPELPGLVRFHTALHGVCCAQRLDFPSRIASTISPAAAALAGQRHMGRDLFAFEKQWLDDHWDEIPDAILGASDFDLHLASMIRVAKKLAPTRQNIEQVINPCELPLGYVLHQNHEPAWRNPKNVDASPSQIHNRALFAAWGRQYAPSLVFHPGNVI